MLQTNYNKHTTDRQDELLWEVDENDNPVGPVTRGECHNEARKPWHRSIHIYLFNPEGLIYFSQRGFNKDTAAGLWTVSAAGHIGYGDTALDTANREIVEELSIKVNLSQIGKLKIDYGSEREIIEIFAGVAYSTPKINPKEVEQIKLFEFDDVCSKFLNKEFDLSGGSRDTFRHVLETEALRKFRDGYLSTKIK